MITKDLSITKPEYWDQVYNGASHGAVDNSNTARSPKAFDRFSWVAGYAEGPNVLGVASGHAHIEKRIRAANLGWTVYASDQSEGAKQAAQFETYYIANAYELPFESKQFTTVICCQAMEYMEEQERFLKEAQRISSYLLITVPIGEMDKWSQLRIYSEESVRKLLASYGTIEVFEREGDLLLVKLLFNV